MGQKYVTVSNTWAIKDTVTSYFTEYALCSGGQAEARSRQRSHHTIWAIFALLSQSHFCVLAWPTKELLMIPQPSEKPVLAFMFHDCSLHVLPSSSQKQ